MAGGGLGDLLNMLEDRGEARVFQVLQELGVMRHDHARGVLQFYEMKVGDEAMHTLLERARRGGR